MDILSLTYPEFCRAAEAAVPSAKGLAPRIYASAFSSGVLDPESAGAGAANAALWREAFSVGLLEVAAMTEEEGEAGRTTKFSFRLRDGREVESVAVPMFGGSHTLCVSSQVGCARACAFCETGRGGLVRNLSSAEIVSQVVTASRVLSLRFRNLVFMGMGEPLDNLDAVLAAVAIFRDQRGLCYSAERITLCTSGVVEGIVRLGEAGLRRLNLSISLNAARDELRNELMPINRSRPLAALAEALAAYPRRRNFVFALNYCLIPGVNDGAEDLDATAAFASRIGRSLVNLIPYNPGSSPIGRSPTEAEISAFMDGLIARGTAVKRRVEKGRALMAACGQLGGRVRETAS